MLDVAERLREFDGRSVEPFRDVAAMLPATPETLAVLVDVAGEREEALQIGATWVLKHLLEQGCQPPDDLGAAVVALLRSTRAPDAQLHLLQVLPRVEVPAASRRSLQSSLARLIGSPKTFVRAWAYNGYAVLGAASPAARRRALALYDRVESGEAASVRARIRHARKALAGH